MSQFIDRFLKALQATEAQVNSQTCPVYAHYDLHAYITIKSRAIGVLVSTNVCRFSTGQR